MGSWFLSIAVRTSGPLVSRSTAQSDFFSLHTLRKRSSTPWCASWSPWEKLKRATFIPASMSSAMVSSSQHLGPMVQTILVFLTMGWSFMIIAVEMPVERTVSTLMSVSALSGGMMVSGW